MLWLAAAAAMRLSHRSEVLPGTTMAGLSIGGADRAQVRRSLTGGLVDDRVVTLRFGTRRFVVNGRSVGLRIGLERTVARAMRSGRRGVVEFIATPAAALGLRRQLQPHYAISPNAVTGKVREVARLVDRPSFQGGLVIDPDTLAVDIQLPRDGRRVDQAATARIVDSELRASTQRPRTLPVGVTAAPPAREVERVAAQARVYLTRPLRLVAPDGAITLDARRVATLLDVERSSTGGGLVLGVDAARVAGAIADIAAERDRRPTNARILAPAAPVVMDAMGSASWRPQRAVVRVRRGRWGRAIRRDQAARRVARAVRSGEHQVTLPIRRLAPAVSTSDARRARNVIGAFTTRFPCCQPRVKNIRLMASAVDGTIVPSGEQFSLNRAAGPRTRRRGFVPAPFIADGEIVPSVGGGVSQFSTTMYNAAYFAGLQIDAHQPHSFYIDRYPPGREATLDYGSIDLSWTNDTGTPILVRTASTATSVTVTLYGANGGRRVRAAAGPRRPVPGRDFTITVTRTIRYPDGRVARQPYITTYDEPPDD